MASESVSILIEAENKASPVVAKVGQDFEGLAKRVKDTGQKTKASVEVFGSLANAFGGTALGAFSSQLGQITEKVSAFSEVAKTGTAGAFAFKLGLAAAAGAVTYKVAETVASWWLEIDKATASAKEAEKAFAKASASWGEVRRTAFANIKEDLSLIRDPGEREQESIAAAARIEKQSKELDSKIAKAQGEVAKRQSQLNAAFLKDRPLVDLQVAQDQLENLKSLKDQLDTESKSLRDLTSERTKSIEARKAENALADKSDAFLKSLREEIELLKATKEERLAIEAGRNATPEQRGLAEELLKERDALREKAEAQKKAEQETELAAKKEADAIQRIADLEKKRMVDIEARRIELEQGREAAQAYRLEQEGLTKATAERLAAQEEAVRKDEEASKNKSTALDSSPQPAVQGRLLTRGTGGDVQTQILNVLKQALGIQQQQLKADEAYLRRKQQDPYVIQKLVVP